MITFIIGLVGTIKIGRIKLYVQYKQLISKNAKLLVWSIDEIEMITDKSDKKLHTLFLYYSLFVTNFFVILLSSKFDY